MVQSGQRMRRVFQWKSTEVDDVLGGVYPEEESETVDDLSETLE